VRLGVTLDPEFAGPGVLVKAVAEGSPAAVAGVVPEDVLVAVDGTDVADARGLRTVLAGKTHGSAFRLRLRRGAETVEKEGRFPDAGPEPAFARRGPFGTVDVRRTGNTFEATCANVSAFDLLVGVGTVDLEQPVVVRVNGAEVSRGTLAPDLSLLLDRAGEDDDPALLYLARIPVRLPDPAPAGK
jgi:hypothetical protein